MRNRSSAPFRTPRAVTTVKRTGNSGTSSQPGRGPRFVGLARSPGQFARLHLEIKRAFKMFSVSALNSAQMEDYFHRAVNAHTLEDVKYFYLLANVFKRFQSSEHGVAAARAAASVEKLLDSEVRCRYSNQVFAGGLDRSNAYIPLHLLPVLRRARRICSAILGPLDLNELPGACGFTPGATTEFRRIDGIHHKKWARAAQISGRALPYLQAFWKWSTMDHFPRSVDIRAANEVFTVPKNFERDRTACKPITWNGFFQKGVGTLIRRRLRRKGLLLPDAQEYHGVLAKVASAVPGLVTRDLASASDTIALALVECLLPPDWFQLIADHREWLGILPDGRLVRWEKVSSMGNGFTFELETLLFYSLVKAACSTESLVSVYGDDILFPSRHVTLVDELLTFCGFEVNREKSFGLETPFRESCGGHYWRGHDVKPFYITRMPRTCGDVINLHNDVVRWVGDYPRPGHFLYDLWRTCRSIVPREYWGPKGLQGNLWAEWDDARPTWVPKYQAFRVGMISFEQKPLELTDGTAAQSQNIETGAEEYGGGSDHFGAYLQKLWRVDPDPWDSTETTTYRQTVDRERRTWRYVDRAQWNRYVGV